MSSALEQRSFGRTGKKVSVIGLGGAALYKHSYEQGIATVKHMCLSAHEYSLLARQSPQTMLPVVREQGIAYVVGGIFSKFGLGVSTEASPFQLARS